MAMTLEEAEVRIAQLEQRMVALATAQQVSNLSSQITSWRSETNAALNTILGRLDALEAGMTDVKGRLTLGGL